MKKVWVLLTSLFFSLSVYSQGLTCLNKLLPFNKHSGLHQVTKEEWQDIKDPLDTLTATNALNFLINSKLFCQPGEVVIKVTPVCQPVIKDIEQSNSCFTFTNLGYFLVTKDNGKNINFIFSKDNLFNN